MTPRQSSFVVFPLGEKRFALPAEMVNEMACPDRVQSFPHTTPLLSGVLVRRGRIVPVCDIARVLAARTQLRHRLCIIVTLPFDSGREWVAVPVTGDGELVNAEMLPPDGRLPQYVAGLLALQHEIVEVIDLSSLILSEGRA